MSRPSKKNSSKIARVKQQIVDIRSQMADFDLVCSGHLLRRTKVCGKPSCRCATDPAYRHGPYYEWSRWKNGRLVHTVLSPLQAQELARAIKNHRSLTKLLASWIKKSQELICSTEYLNGDTNDT